MKVMSKVIQEYNVEDFKDAQGLWVRSFRPTTNVIHTTRAGTLWNAVNYRTKKGNKIAEKTISYADCTNDFKEFQSFTEWCQVESLQLDKSVGQRIINNNIQTNNR